MRNRRKSAGKTFFELGFTPTWQTYETFGTIFDNIIAERSGLALRNEVIVVGAHYDSHRDSPGADDNACAIAALLELARAVTAWQPQRTVRLVAFTNAESPFTRTEHMGTLLARAGEVIE